MHNFRKVLSTFRTYCPVGVQVAKTVDKLPTFKFRPGWKRVTQSLCPCMRSSCCTPPPFTRTSRQQPTVMSQCVCASFKISQIQLDRAVTLHCGLLGCCLGPTACTALCTFRVSRTLPKHNLSMQQRVFYWAPGAGSDEEASGDDACRRDQQHQSSLEDDAYSVRHCAAP